MHGIKFQRMGSGCGPVGRVVASVVRIQSLANYIYHQVYSKGENKEKESENGPFLFNSNELLTTSASELQPDMIQMRLNAANKHTLEKK